MISNDLYALISLHKLLNTYNSYMLIRDWALLPTRKYADESVITDVPLKIVYICGVDFKTVKLVTHTHQFRFSVVGKPLEIEAAYFEMIDHIQEVIDQSKEQEVN